MENEKENVRIKIITPMLSHGFNKKKAEFRISELRAAMRFWWRASRSFNSCFQKKKEGDLLTTLLSEEEKLFGSKEKISPVMFRKRKKYLKHTEIEFRSKGKTFFINGIDQDNSIPLSVSFINKQEDNNKYLKILELVSYLGGLGQKSRKGYGVFAVEGTKKCENIEMLVENIKNCIKELGGEFKDGEENIDKKFYEIRRKDEGFQGNYAFIKKICIYEAISKDEFLKKAENVLKGIKLNYGTKKQRLASPVNISCYPKDGSGEMVFPVITILNNITVEENTKYAEKENLIIKKFKQN